MHQQQNAIREYRAKAGISLDVLAVRIGISSASLSRIERGLQFPGRDVTARLVAETGVSADAILGIAPSLAEAQKGAANVN